MESADYQTELDRLSFRFTVTLALHVNISRRLTWCPSCRPLSSVRTLYIECERKLDFAGWCSAIRVAANSGEDTLSEQQLTEADIPVTVHSCISYITQCGEDTHTHSHGSRCKCFQTDAQTGFWFCPGVSEAGLFVLVMSQKATSDRIPPPHKVEGMNRLDLNCESFICAAGFYGTGLLSE